MNGSDHQFAGFRQQLQTARRIERVLGIQAGDGFIDDQNVRIRDQCPGKHGAREFPAGKRGCRLLAMIEQVARLQGLGNFRTETCGQTAECRQGWCQPEGNQSFNRNWPFAAGILRQIGAATRQLRAGERAKGNAVEHHGAGIRLQQSCQHRQQRRLARPVRPDNGDKIAGLGMQRNVLENRALAATDENLCRVEATHEPLCTACKRLLRSAAAASALSTTPQL